MSIHTFILKIASMWLPVAKKLENSGQKMSSVDHFFKHNLYVILIFRKRMITS